MCDGHGGADRAEPPADAGDAQRDLGGDQRRLGRLRVKHQGTKRCVAGNAFGGLFGRFGRFGKKSPLLSSVVAC